tara:strand:+ start:1124 stop:1666 length:543 start_codon:yes stop_codon:yes gene_type:complete
VRKLIVFALLSVLTGTNNGYAKEDCLSISKKPVKVEAWVSKKYEKNYRNIRREFAEMGNTKVGLFFYPAENPSRVVAIGRCVPAYIAQHFLKKAWKYSLGTTHLVHQGFFSSHWAGVGTSLFSENSMNSISPKKLNELMDEGLDTESFHKLYRALTTQKKKVPAFGLMLDNPKLIRDAFQ